MPLRSLQSKINVVDQPEGLWFWMADGERRIRVFVTFEALHHELDNYSPGPLDQFSGAEILEKNREKIEAAASKKYDAEGVQGQLNGAPVLFVTAQDL